MWIARRRLADDLERWRAHGWVTAEGEVYVKRDLLERHHGPGLPAVLAILGVVLLGFAAMSFVAANWQDMPRLLRLAIIFAGLGGAYSAAAGLFVRGTDAFAHSAILLGVAVFGSGIMLIAQMYHIEGHPPDAMLVWALGALAAGVLVRSNPPLAASTLLFGIWSGWEMGLSSTIHWPLLAAAAAMSVAFALNRWWPGLHLVATLLTGWLIATGYVVKGDAGQWAVVVTGLAVAMTALVAAHRSRTEALGTIVSDVAAAVLGYAMIAAFAGLWALQFFERNDTAGLVLFAAGTVSLLIVAIHQGLKLGFRGAVWLGYAGFSAEIFALYVKTVGSLLGSSLFFLVAGLIVIALAAVAWRLHRIGGGETAGGGHAMTEGDGVSAQRSHTRTATMQTASKQIAAWLGHWRYALLALVALGQAAVLVYMVADREALLANGRAIDLKVVPLDPRDLFRGDYVTLSYDISRIPRSMIAGELHRGDKLFVRLAHDVEGWKPVAAARTRQQAGSAGAGEIVLAGRVRFAPRVFTTSADQSISVNYGIEKFFVPEGVGREIEKEVRAKDVTAHVAVGTDGIAALKGLTVSGVRYDLPPLF